MIAVFAFDRDNRADLLSLRYENALGLEKDGRPYTSQEEASNAIDAWLENNCHQARNTCD